MDFARRIIEKLNTHFWRYGFHIVEERTDFLKLKSNKITIVFSHDWRGNENNFFFQNIEINNDALKSFFHSDLKLSQLPIDQFVINLGLFFDNEGKSLMMGDEKKLSEIETFNLVRARKYTNNLIRSQVLPEADRAWHSKDFKNFILLLDKLDIGDLAQSYKLKYEIAKKKV